MATFVKFNKFLEQLGKKNFDFAADVLKYALTNTAPTPATDVGYLPGTLHPVPAAANGYTAGGYTAPSPTWADSGGTSTLSINSGSDPVCTATAGGIGPFRYVLLYDDTATATGNAVADALIGYWDYGSSITLAVGETFTFDGGTSLFAIT
jgi:hypothetical protein